MQTDASSTAAATSSCAANFVENIVNGGRLREQRQLRLHVQRIDQRRGAIRRQRTGTLEFNGVNTYKGYGVVVGNLNANSGAVLSDTDPVYVFAASSLRLGTNEAVGSLGGGSLTTGGTVDLQGHTLTIGGDNLHSVFAGLFTGAGTVRKVGSGVQIIGYIAGGGSTGYTGKWEVANGILAVCPSTLRRGRISSAPIRAWSSPTSLPFPAGRLPGASNTTGSATYSMLANRGITVTAASGLANFQRIVRHAEHQRRDHRQAKLTKTGGNFRSPQRGQFRQLQRQHRCARRRAGNAGTTGQPFGSDRSPPSGRCFVSRRPTSARRVSRSARRIDLHIRLGLGHPGDGAGRTAR